MVSSSSNEEREEKEEPQPLISWTDCYQEEQRRVRMHFIFLFWTDCYHKFHGLIIIIIFFHFLISCFLGWFTFYFIKNLWIGISRTNIQTQREREHSVVQRKREIELYAGNRENTIEDSVVRRKRDRKSNRWYISIITNTDNTIIVNGIGFTPLLVYSLLYTHNVI